MSTEGLQQMTWPEFDWFVGIDWGTVTHVVRVTDAEDGCVGERKVPHSSAGLRELVSWLRSVAGGRMERVAVAIEAPRGALVDTLLEAGMVVFTLNPKQVDRFRDRFSVAGAKDDRFDARVLGSALRTDRHCFRRLAAEDARVIQVRELTRAAEDLAEEFQAHANRLREQVHRIAPAWGALSPNADDPWFWKLLEQVRTPVRASRVRRPVIERVLRTYRIRRVTADDVLTVLKTPPVYVAAGTVEATTQHIALLIPRLRLAHAQRQECEGKLAALLDALTEDEPSPPSGPETPSGPDTPSGPSDIAILRSITGAGTQVTALVIAEAMRMVTTRDYRGLRAASGVAPVRRQTGKNQRGMVSMRYACNPRLRQAMFWWALASTRFDAAAKSYYATLRARGHTHGRALRSVADRWLRILMAMLKTRTLYDPSRFTMPVPAEA